MTCATGGALSLTTRVLEDLVVNESLMLANLHFTQGLICSESVKFRLGEILGRQNAHDLVYESAVQAHPTGQTLGEVLGENEMQNRSLSKEEIANLLSPERYLGHAAAFVGRVLARSR
jgi:adenylosuccinate lyase